MAQLFVERGRTIFQIFHLIQHRLLSVAIVLRTFGTIKVDRADGYKKSAVRTALIRRFINIFGLTESTQNEKRP